MFPEPTELLLIGYLIESIGTPKSKSSTLTPKTNSQTYWPRETSHVMNGIIFCVCLTLAISVLQIVLKQCRKERKKIQVKKESQQNRSRWWIWSRDAAKGLLTCYLLLHQKARGKPNTKVNLLWACKLRSTIERWDPLCTHTHQATQNGTLIKTWSFQEWKSDELMEDRTGRPVVTAQHTDRFIVENDKMNSYIEAESEVSLESRTFLHRVNDQVRTRQNQSSKDTTNRQRQTFCDMGNVYVFYIASICIHGEELLWHFAFHQKYRRSHNGTDVRHIWKFENRTIRRDLWNEYN